MMDLSTKYLGLSLKNPVVVASCGLTRNIDQIKKCEEAGAGAVVMKSLFEEQIREMDAGLKDSADMHTEALDYLRAEIEMQLGPREYLETIKQAKKSVTIPIIASVNCFSAKWWTSYAQQIEAAGADALELNIYVLPYSFDISGYNIENAYIEILQAVKQHVNIPIALKLSPYFTAFGNLAEKLDKLGADALVLFNRFVQPDIDITTITASQKPSFNDPIGFSNTLRWIALLSGRLKLDLAASGNIRTPSDMIKQLLAGATVIQIASVLYKDGLGTIDKFVAGLADWMREHNFATIQDFRGRLSQQNNPQSDAYIRAQYLKAISGVE
ncbi:MAG: dihydroorotate dehydrogenase-like protein [candidate division KSB1 bacterium]|nr:dihydroorotate dehydrogenase-like protein [candidate division KSB1 bacterium]MDZ7340608.1 dihydroorotate dehydrogenase-like protein [candidate division KSB1 bacterium]